ncbi:MAG: family 16 glycosylhydrolase [Ignavibacteria bacterium]|nr:family 16 glycosylhydrolase [Ignavibacteria bacterium]
MRKKYNISQFAIIYYFLSVLLCTTFLSAQNRVLVWADEFDHSIDFSVWDFDIGPTNDNVHYYTNRPQNMQVFDSVLNIIALEEFYMGYNYTSALLKTKINWRYGRFEARINLPETNGFVPAFWMLPSESSYGWWPKSGEIDIMEQPSNEISNIYGTIHTETYNSFTGSGPVGDVTVVPNAQTSFHLYAIEWTPNQIDFYVDAQNYFSFSNDHTGSATWPFDKPFYIILNLAVGGAWVGNPDSTTVFPAIMEVDYVRVYQYFDDVAINGADDNPYFSSDISYSVPDLNSASYSWEVPGNAQIVAGQNTNQINVDWNYFGGDIKANVTTSAGSRIINFPVKVSDNLLKNPGFEKGVKYWNGIVHYPAQADFSLDTNTVFYGNQSLSVDVETLGANPWDIQCSQADIIFEAGEEYILRFRAKTDNSAGDINLAIISFDPLFVYYSEIIHLTNNWTQYEINYTATTSDTVAINIDLSFQTGVYYLDNFLLTTPELLSGNQIKNADFFDADSFWNFVTLSLAQATGTVIDGEYNVIITNGGNNIWDIHLGQSGINMESGQEYTVSFDAYAAASRTISALVGKNSAPWTVYHTPQIFSLTTSKQTYTYSFVMNDPSDNQSRFGFDIGGSTIDVFFDNIRVSSGTTPVNISEILIAPKSFQLFQNYPNPFNPNTTIKYQIPDVSFVTLKVYDVLGIEITTLVNEEKSVGSYEVEFNATQLPSGIYFYILQAGSFVETKKMVLMK